MNTKYVFAFFIMILSGCGTVKVETSPEILLESPVPTQEEVQERYPEPDCEPMVEGLELSDENNGYLLIEYANCLGLTRAVLHSVVELFPAGGQEQ